jgi:hypothetical protein
MSQLINYKTRYHKFIEQRLHRAKTRSKGYAGSDSKSNLVKLTHREHWVAHRMLAKMYSGKKRVQMYHALWYMVKTSPYKCNSRTYEHIRQEHSKTTKKQWKNGNFNKKTHSDRFKKLWQDPEWRAQVLEKRRIAKLHPEVRKKYSENGMKGAIARWGH